MTVTATTIHTDFPDDMIAAAVGYWAAHLRHGAIGDEKAIDRLPAPGILNRALDRVRRATPEPKVKAFEEALTRLLKAAPRGEYGVLSTGWVQLRVDYDPQGLLYRALEEAFIVTIGKLPFKTCMTLRMISGVYDPVTRSYPHRRGIIDVSALGGEHETILYPTDVFEVWKSADSLTVSSPEQIREQRIMGLLEADAEPIYALRGTWTEVMTAHHEIQGWGPYRPMA